MFLETVYVVLANMQQKILCKLQKKENMAFNEFECPFDNCFAR